MYTPNRANATALHICLGYTKIPVVGSPGTGANISNSSQTGPGNVVNVNSIFAGFIFVAADVGNVIMIAGAGPGGYPLWTVITSVVNADQATVADNSTIAAYAVQAVIYREVCTAVTTNGNGYILSGSIRFRSSLTTRSNLTFDCFSVDASFLPQAGQPVLAYYYPVNTALPSAYNPSATYSAGSYVLYFGQIFQSVVSGNTGNTPVSGKTTAYWSSQDVFGGKIHQAKATNWPGQSAVITNCQCVSWDVVLTDAVLSLRAAGNSAITQGLIGNGSKTSWNLTYIPVSVISIQEVSVSNVTTSGTTVTWVSGYDFSDLVVGNTVYIAGVAYTIATISGRESLTVTVAPPSFVSGFPASFQGLSNTAGVVNTSSSGNTVTFQAGCNFAGLSPGSTIQLTDPSTCALIGTFTVATVVNPNKINLTTNPGTHAGAGWIGPPVTFGLTGSGAEYTWTNANSSIVQNPNYAPMANSRNLLVLYTYVGLSNFYNSTAGAIATALASALLNDNVTVEAEAGPTVTSIGFDAWDNIDVCLAKLCQYVSLGTSVYWYYMDARIVLHFELQATTSVAPFNLSVSDDSDGNFLIEVSNTQTMEKMANAALLATNNTLGSQVLSQIIPADGTKRTFNTSLPIGQLVSVSFTGGLGSFFYYQIGVLNAGTITAGMYWTPNSTALTLDVAATPPIGGYLTVSYIPLISALLTYYNTTAIAARQLIEGGSGEHDSYSAPTTTLPVLASGVSLAQIVATYFAPISQGITALTFRFGLQTGQSITANLPAIAANGSYVVDSVTMVDNDQLLKWTVTVISGAAIGDWRTAFKNLSGQGGASITAIGGAGGSSGGASSSNPTPIAATITANYAPVIPAPTSDGQCLLIKITQGGSGGYSIDWTNGGTNPVAVNTFPSVPAGLMAVGQYLTVICMSYGGVWHSQALGVT